MFVVDNYATCSPISLPSLKVLHQLNTWVLERHASLICFSLGPDLILYFSKQNVGIIFCIDGPACLNENKMDNSLPIPKERCQYISSREWRLCGVFSTHTLSSLSEGFTPFEHSSPGEICFSKPLFKSLNVFRRLDSFFSKKFDNKTLLHANRHFLFTHLSCRA